MANLELVDLWTIDGNPNDPQSEALASFMTIAVKRVLSSQKDTFGFRARATADNPSQMVGLGTAFVTKIARSVVGTDYDLVKGSETQRSREFRISIPIDQHLTFKRAIETMDLDRLWNSSAGLTVEERGAVLGTIMESFATSMVINRELLIQRAMKDHAIASYPTRPQNILVLDKLKSAGNEIEATNAYYAIAENINNISMTTNNYVVNAPAESIFISLGLKSYTALSRAYTKVAGLPITSDVMANGALYKDKIWNVDVYKNIWFDRDFNQNAETKMNKDVSYNFRGFLGVIASSYAWSFFDGAINNWNQLDKDTGNMVFGSKQLLSIPTPIYPELYTVILEKAPTVSEIAQARANCYKMGIDFNKNEFQKSFKLSEEEPLDFQVRWQLENKTNGLLTTLFTDPTPEKFEWDYANTVSSLWDGTVNPGDEFFVDFVTKAQTAGFVLADIVDLFSTRLHIEELGNRKILPTEKLEDLLAEAKATNPYVQNLTAVIEKGTSKIGILETVRKVIIQL